MAKKTTKKAPATKLNVSEQKVVREFIKKANVILERLSNDRDALRELVSTCEDVLCAADEAYDDFERAIDRLSEMI